MYTTVDYYFIYKRFKFNENNSYNSYIYLKIKNANLTKKNFDIKVEPLEFFI